MARRPAISRSTLSRFRGSCVWPHKTFKTKMLRMASLKGRSKVATMECFTIAKKLCFRTISGIALKRHFKLNTLDLERDRPNRDGIVRGWFDGKLVIDRTDILLRSTDFPDMKFNQFLLAPYFGPGLLPHAQKLWIDELVVGTQRIGPLR